MPAGDERQPFEADHRVAAPVGEPVVAGDDGADLIARGMRARGIFGASDRRDQKLIGGQHQLGSRRLLRARRGRVRKQSAAPPLLLAVERLLRSQGAHTISQVFGGGYQRGVLSPAYRSTRKYPGLQRDAARFVAAVLFDAVEHGFCRLRSMRESRRVRRAASCAARQVGASGDFVSVFERREHIAFRQSARIDWRFVRAKVHAPAAVRVERCLCPTAADT